MRYSVLPKQLSVLKSTLKSRRKRNKILKNYDKFICYRYDIGISNKRYLKCRHDTDTDISISAIYRRYFRPLHSTRLSTHGDRAFPVVAVRIWILEQSSAAYHICSVTSCLLLSLEDTSSNSVIRDYCCRTSEMTIEY